MQWSDVAKQYVQALKPVKSNPALMERILGLIDLTSLNESDTESSIAEFIQNAQTPFGHVAAVCTYPDFVRIVAAEFADKPVKVATVVNFPAGAASLETALIEISRALQDGAQEIDVVFPYQRYLDGEREYAQRFVAGCKAACGENVTLKVILETAALGDLAVIAAASNDVINAGADFIKTSTGKIAQGATLEAAAIMLLMIKEKSPLLKRRIGFKVSGGIRELEQAIQYVELADNIMGRDWVTADTFRIGASKLVDEMLKHMQIE